MCLLQISLELYVTYHCHFLVLYFYFMSSVLLQQASLESKLDRKSNNVTNDDFFFFWSWKDLIKENHVCVLFCPEQDLGRRGWVLDSLCFATTDYSQIYNK